MRITVAGAGIIGLSTAYVLKKSGHDVNVVAEKFSPDITSNRAAAFWFPYHIRSDSRGKQWCRESYDFYSSINDSASGISLKKIVKAISNKTENEDDSWIDFMPSGKVSLMDRASLPEGYRKAYMAYVPLIETQIFLPWLMKELKQSGVNFKQKKVTSLIQDEQNHYVINCTGLGSKEIQDDDDLYAVRGQVAILSPKEMDHIFLENEKPCYMVPRKDAIIVGGTYEEHADIEKTDQPTLNILKENIFSIFPELRDQKEIGSWAGLRPFRKVIRLEKEGNVIHNYGHGGSGFTLAWGCANTVNDIIKQEGL